MFHNIDNGLVFIFIFEKERKKNEKKEEKIKGGNSKP